MCVAAARGPIRRAVASVAALSLACFVGWTSDWAAPSPRCGVTESDLAGMALRVGDAPIAGAPRGSPDLSEASFIPLVGRPGVGPDPVQVERHSTRRVHPRHLVAVPVGRDSMTFVAALLGTFPPTPERAVFFFFPYEPEAVAPLLDAVCGDLRVHVIVAPGRPMKWWLLKHYITPDVASAFDAVYPWDADIDPDTVRAFDPDGYVKVIRHHGAPISQPLNLGPSAWGVTQGREVQPCGSGDKCARTALWTAPKRAAPDGSVRVQYAAGEASAEDGRWVDFVECGPFPVLEATAWECVWRMLQADLSTGWGVDLVAFPYCSRGRLALITRWPLRHADHKSASSGHEWCPILEKREYLRRFSHATLPAMKTGALAWTVLE